MAREYARIMTAIWDNAAFIALSEPAQRVYLLLITQPDISAAGVLRMWVPRWAEMSATSNPDDLTQHLKELEASRFIVLDLTAGELLIRSFIKWDAGYNNLKRKPVIKRAREEVRSSRIKEYLNADFVRFGLDSPPPGGGGISVPADGASMSTDDNVDKASDSLSVADTPEGRNAEDSALSHVDGLSGRTSTCSGVVVAYPHSATPHSATPSDADASAAARSLFAVDEPAPPAINAGAVTATWSDAFTGSGARPTDRQKGQVASEAKQLLDAGNDPELVLELAERAGAKRRQNLIAELALAVPRTPLPSKQTLTGAAIDSLGDAFAEYERRHGNVHQLPQRGA